jgi:hypothetical protein
MEQGAATKAMASTGTTHVRVHPSKFKFIFSVLQQAKPVL